MARKNVGVAVGNQVTRDAVVDDRDEPTDTACDHRHAAGGRFERDEAETLAARRHDDEIGRAVVGRKNVVRLRRDEIDAIGHTEGLDEGANAQHLGLAVVAAGPADDDQAGTAVVEAREGLDRHVETFQRLDAPDEEHHRHVVRQTQRVACAALLTRSEERVLDTRGDDLDRARWRSVQGTELALFFGARNADRIGTTDDRRLGLFARDGFGVTALCLHAGEGVEGHHERQVEFVLQAVPRDARQPVVRVQDVGATRRRHVVAHAVGENVDDGQQFVLRQVEVSGLDVHDAVVRLDVDDPGKAGAPRACVGGAVEARMGEGRHQFTHVDIHAAAVTHTRLRQRRGVHRENRDALHVNRPSDSRRCGRR